MNYWVYILASRPGGTLTKRYGIKTLVYYEQYDVPSAAIQREKNIKHWPREWKIDLILSSNPEWADLYDEIVK